MKKEDINERIVMVMEHFKFTPSIFADELGIIRSSMSHIINGRNKPGLEVIQKLLARFPEIHPDWVLSGKGQMIKSTEPAELNFMAPIDENVAITTPGENKVVNSDGETINSLFEQTNLFAATNKQTQLTVDTEIVFQNPPAAEVVNAPVTEPIQNVVFTSQPAMPLPAAEPVLNVVASPQPVSAPVFIEQPLEISVPEQVISVPVQTVIPPVIEAEKAIEKEIKMEIIPEIKKEEKSIKRITIYFSDNSYQDFLPDKN